MQEEKHIISQAGSSGFVLCLWSVTMHYRRWFGGGSRASAILMCPKRGKNCYFFAFFWFMVKFLTFAVVISAENRPNWNHSFFRRHHPPPTNNICMYVFDAIPLHKIFVTRHITNENIERCGPNVHSSVIIER